MADFALSEDGLGYDIAMPYNSRGKRDFVIVRGPKAIAQRIQMKLRTFLGECRYNRLVGFPWQQVVFQRGVSNQAVQAVLDQFIRNIDGVLDVVSITLTRDARTRKGTGKAVVRVLDEAANAVELVVPLELRF